jgi:hypothetical protein
MPQSPLYEVERTHRDEHVSDAKDIPEQGEFRNCKDIFQERQRGVRLHSNRDIDHLSRFERDPASEGTRLC